MSMYEKWLSLAYDSKGQTVEAFWNDYMPLEQRVYEALIGDAAGDEALEGEQYGEVQGSISDIAVRFGLTEEQAIGFIDGINDALDTPFREEELKGMEADTQVLLRFSFESLYKKMVEYGAEHLYKLPQWDKLLGEQRCERLYKEQKRSTTVVKERLPGRNDPCTCGSGSKFKKCCGAAV